MKGPGELALNGTDSGGAGWLLGIGPGVGRRVEIPWEGSMDGNAGANGASSCSMGLPLCMGRVEISFQTQG